MAGIPTPQEIFGASNGASGTASAPATNTAMQAIDRFNTQAAAAAQTAGQNLIATYLEHLGILQFIGLIVFLAIVAGIVYFVIETGWWTLRVERFHEIVLQSNISKRSARTSWDAIESHFYRGTENDLKVAILEADKLLNDALREAGIMGIQLGDRLKKANERQIPNLNELWQAHKLRNQIAHEPNFKLKRDLAERALKIYETGLKNLGVFDDGRPV